MEALDGLCCTPTTTSNGARAAIEHILTLDDDQVAGRRWRTWRIFWPRRCWRSSRGAYPRRYEAERPSERLGGRFCLTRTYRACSIAWRVYFLG
jgi:hypothetical protein